MKMMITVLNKLINNIERIKITKEKSKCNERQLKSSGTKEKGAIKNLIMKLNQQ